MAYLQHESVKPGFEIRSKTCKAMRSHSYTEMLIVNSIIHENVVILYMRMAHGGAQTYSTN
jgi:hypothetical protein